MNDVAHRDLTYYIASWEARNKRLPSPRPVTIDGLSVWVNGGVFSPDPQLTHSSSMLVRLLPQLNNKTFLDLGTGCGIVALHAIGKGALHVTASDIQPEALANAHANAEMHRKLGRIEIVESDVFEKVGATYDVIAANLPFMVTTYEFNHIATETYRRFFAGLAKHLSPAGAAYLTFGSWGDVVTLEQMIEAANLKVNRAIEQREEASWHVFQVYVEGTTCPDLWNREPVALPM